MKESSERPTGDIETVVYTYGNTLYRICLVMLGNENDAEDAVQEAFISYMQRAPSFKDFEHEKAWLITVASNKCRDALRYRKRHPQIDPEQLQGISQLSSDSGILEALMTLPEKFRIVMILYYVEEYRVNDIAQIIGKTVSAVKMRLQKGRSLLEETYRKEYL